MAKDPAVLFYTSDFLTGTMTMTNEQVGKYIRLLCLQHQKNFLTEEDMTNICNSYDKHIYSKFTHADGVYFNERMREEKLKRINYSQSRSGNRSGKHRRRSCPAADPALLAGGCRAADYLGTDRYPWAARLP